jgi:hypothetical protein
MELFKPVIRGGSLMAKDSGGPSIVTILLLGGAAYLAYEFFFASSSSAAASAPPATPGTAPGTTPTPATPTSTTAASASSLDAMYQNMVNAATAANFTSGNPDQWGYYFAQGNKPQVAPAPESAGFDRANNWPTTLTAAQYWTAIAPKVAAANGLSGLGVLAGLGTFLWGSRQVQQ